MLSRVTVKKCRECFLRRSVYIVTFFRQVAEMHNMLKSIAAVAR